MLPEGTSRMPGPRTRQADICHMTQVGLWAVFGHCSYEHMFAIKSNSRIIQARG